MPAWRCACPCIELIWLRRLRTVGDKSRAAAMWSSLLLFVVTGVSACSLAGLRMLSPPVLREPFITRLSLFVSGVLIPFARSVENSILVSGVWSLVPELRIVAILIVCFSRCLGKGSKRVAARFLIMPHITDTPVYDGGVSRTAGERLCVMCVCVKWME